MMTAAFSRRGPDGQGTFTRDRVTLGHRRLSIIDLETGKQPMFNEDGSVGLTFNGEIYNFKELRSELESTGHRFGTSSDSEVIVHAWEQWGTSCVERFRGMFAFSIADWNQKVLFLARDHFGIKPLYYTTSKTGFAFASELQALRTLEWFSPEIDLQALDQYLFLQYIPAPKTIYRNTFKLPPAHRLVVRFDGQLGKPERYWRPTYDPIHNRSVADWAEQLDSVLRESVKAHLVSDVPFGAFLSGGMDSTLVTGYMAQELAQPVKTFSIGFEESEYNELAYAEQAAKRWGTEHHVDIVKPDAIGTLPKLVKHYGEPFGDSSAIPTYYVSKMARSAVPMILSGDGGDEIFGGYDSYRAWLRWLQPPPPNRPAWKRLLRPLAAAIRPDRHPPDVVSREPSLNGWYGCVQYMPASLRQHLWRKEHHHAICQPVDVFESAFAESHSYPAVRRAQHMDTLTYLPFDILTKVDIASMMHGLEVRTPLIDVKVAEFAGTIPEDLTLHQTSIGQYENKYLIRSVLSKYFPPSFIDRPKMGFAVPVAKWFAKGGQLAIYSKEKLLSQQSRLYDYFEPKSVSELIKKNHKHGAMTGPLWLLIFLDEWLNQSSTPKN